MRGIVPLLLLVLVIAGVGGTNFYRNVQTENQQERTFGKYSDEDIQAMIGGVKSDIDSLNARYEAQKQIDSRSKPRGSMHDNMKELERVQDATRVVRELGQAVSQQDEHRHELEEEAAHRERNSDKLQVFLHRLTTF